LAAVRLFDVHGRELGPKHQTHISPQESFIFRGMKPSAIRPSDSQSLCQPFNLSNIQPNHTEMGSLWRKCFR